MSDELKPLSGDEMRVLLDEITDRIEKLTDASYCIGDPNKGKVVWPPTEEMSYEDAITTCFDIEDCSLDFSFTDEDDKEYTDGLSVIFNNTEMYPNSPGVYARKSLKLMLEQEYTLYVEENDQDCPNGRLFARLIKAFEEPA